MIIDGKIYRNLPQQVEKNKEDIAKLQEGFTQSGYTKAEADAKFADKIDTENSIPPYCVLYYAKQIYAI